MHGHLNIKFCMIEYFITDVVCEVSRVLPEFNVEPDCIFLTLKSRCIINIHIFIFHVVI